MTLALLWQYRRAIAAAAVLALCVLSVLYLRAAITERDDLRTVVATQAAKLEAAAAMQAYTNQVTEAIGQIRIRSQINVSKIESEQKPVFPQSSTINHQPGFTASIPFIAGGVLQAVYSTAHHPAGAAPGPAPGGALAADVTAGGVLPR